MEMLLYAWKQFVGQPTWSTNSTASPLLKSLPLNSPKIVTKQISNSAQNIAPDLTWIDQLKRPKRFKAIKMGIEQK